MESFAVNMDNLHEEVARQLFFNTVAYFTHQATQCAVRNQKLKHFKNIKKPKKKRYQKDKMQRSQDVLKCIDGALIQEYVWGNNKFADFYV